jgi:ArsR family transcriptional regulator
MSLLPGQFERIAKALSDPRRREILETVAAVGDFPCSELGRGFPVSKATLSHHLKELTTAGLVHPRRAGQYVCYEARPAVVRAYVAELLRRLDPLGA